MCVALSSFGGAWVREPAVALQPRKGLPALFRWEFLCPGETELCREPFGAIPPSAVEDFALESSFWRDFADIVANVVKEGQQLLQEEAGCQ